MNKTYKDSSLGQGITRTFTNPQNGNQFLQCREPSRNSSGFPDCLLFPAILYTWAERGSPSVNCLTLKTKHDTFNSRQNLAHKPLVLSDSRIIPLKLTTFQHLSPIFFFLVLKLSIPYFINFHFQHSSQELNDDVKVVSSKWLESCFRKRRIQETAPYEKQRKEKN